MPEWGIDLVRQFPMVGVVILVFLLAERRVKEKEVRLEERYDKSRRADDERGDRMREEVRRDRDAEIARLQDAHARLLAAKDEQIANLTKQLAALTKKLSG